MPTSTSPETPSASGKPRAWWFRLALVSVFFSLPIAGGLLTFLEVLQDGVDGVDGLMGPVSVTVSPDGQHVYVASQDDDAVAVFSRDVTNETLAFVDLGQDGVDGVFGLDGASGVTVSPDGRHVYATAALDDSLVVFGRDASGDALAFTGVETNGVAGVFGLAGASSVAVSPDGRHVFATGSLGGTIAVFGRDATVDDLAFVGVYVDGAGGVDGLAGASSVVVSPDGENVYVAGAADDAIAVFQRNDSTRVLSFLQAVSGLTDLVGPRSLAMSPDGTSLYAAATDSDAIVAFRPDPLGNGILIFDAAYVDGVAGVDGLLAPTAVAVSPDGMQVFATSAVDGTVTQFQRDTATGALTFAGLAENGVGGVTGLDGPSAIGVSPDALHLYVAGRNADALVAFGRTIFFDGFESGDTSAWSATVP